MSGSQIGGVVGGVVGGVIGFYTGNVGAGVRWGYAIGSAAGGYIDPERTYGPRLEDANTQTSTVGGVIPFGYGTFTCMGNIIWCDQLIEHVTTERVGKGGGEKQTTYSYTRSYAIGVCEGPISRYMWIKKNGKIVYAANPAALGAAMGWDGAQIGDLAAASNEFLQMATLYYGSASQMPDPVIEAVEGVGNVAPHRDLAYIVLENEDLTDMQGAVSQYEFCVFTGAAKSYTTQPYPVHFLDGIGVALQPGGGSQQGWPVDDIGVGLAPLGGGFRDVLLRYDMEAEDVGTSLTPLGGGIRDVLVYYDMEAEDVGIVGLQPLGGGMQQVVLTYENYEPEALGISLTPLGGDIS